MRKRFVQKFYPTVKMQEISYGSSWIALLKIQGVERWADGTNAYLLHMPRIKATIPNALFIHNIRDGRDVATSLNHLGWPSRVSLSVGQEPRFVGFSTLLGLARSEKDANMAKASALTI